MQFGLALLIKSDIITLMKVGLDISSLVYGRGVSRYTSNLVRSLLKTRPDLDLKLYGNSRGRVNELEAEVKKLRVPNRKFKFYEQQIPQSVLSFTWRLGLNPLRQVFGDPVDVFHSWDWLQPPAEKWPLVSTIHDLAILKFPETAKKEVIKAHQRSWRLLRERQAEIIAVSESTRQDIINLLGFAPYQVTTIYEALPAENMLVAEKMTEASYQVARDELKLTELGIGEDAKPYILFVGTREPRKNLARLIEAWQPLAEYVSLVIAGEKGWDQTGVNQNSLPEPIFLGRVTDEQLAVLYNEANLFAYPSLDEGFGLPILESFYYGTPVLTSNLSAMKEIAGEAAFLIDPTSVESIYQGLIATLNASEEEHQKRLQLMLLRQRLFSWEKTAEETALVYQKAVHFHNQIHNSQG